MSYRPRILDQYNALQQRYEAILKHLQDSDILRQMLVAPKTVINIDRGKQTEMVNTKLIHDMENSERALMEKAQALHGKKDLNLADQRAVLQNLKEQKQLLKSYHARVYDAQSVVLQPTNALPEPKQKERTQRLDKEVAEEKANDEKLVKGLMWMTNGPESWVEEDRRRAALSGRGGTMSFHV
ncbi:hypothetical protein HK097_002953 [Rhizophlyctis rosea]|uniref:Uncharacterized protein n=1 Tax=Rhizophlyctis rosea TaxID=64517 RepID=A0AAD5SAF0_9FUNG|nr:hypothetical protein HK097_002953 [Rhizophlyctis rosea]